MTSNPSEGGIYAAMARILAEFPVVPKGRKNSGGGNYMYRGIDDVYTAAHGLLAKHGVFPMPNITKMEFELVGETKNGVKQFRCTVHGILTFAHADGSVVDVDIAGEGIDTGDKGGMKAISNAVKYAYWNTFCVPTDVKKDSEAFDEPDLSGSSASSTGAVKDDEDFEPRGRR